MAIQVYGYSILPTSDPELFEVWQDDEYLWEGTAAECTQYVRELHREG